MRQTQKENSREKVDARSVYTRLPIGLVGTIAWR
jgi:hypothetical protein